jgi:hypothetical protein
MKKVYFAFPKEHMLKLLVSSVDDIKGEEKIGKLPPVFLYENYSNGNFDKKIGKFSSCTLVGYDAHRLYTQNVIFYFHIKPYKFPAIKINETGTSFIFETQINKDYFQNSIEIMTECNNFT